MYIEQAVMAMPLQARRIFRLGLVMALSLAVAYALVLPLPFLAPLFAVMLTAKPSPPMGLKSLTGLILVVILTLGIGLLLLPLLIYYPLSAILIITVGVYWSNYLTVNMGKGLVGMFLALGFTLIPAAGTVDISVATTVIQGLAIGIAVAIICQWLVYPFFPEDPPSGSPASEPVSDPVQCNWIALRATFVVLPTFLLTLTNPLLYLPIIIKALLLGQQASVVDARHAGRELLGSTFMGGIFALLFWFMLDVVTNLWMFFWWMLLFGIYFSSKLYQHVESRYPASFWVNVVVTMLILLGPAVEDSASGKDVYKAFFIRMGLFILVTLYAWLAIYFLEYLRNRRQGGLSTPLTNMESPG